MFGNDPWVSAARAWLAIHSAGESRYSLGLARLELPIAGGNDPSWYYEMRALCHAGPARHRSGTPGLPPPAGARTARRRADEVPARDRRRRRRRRRAGGTVVARGLAGSDLAGGRVPDGGRAPRVRARGDQRRRGPPTRAAEQAANPVELHESSTGPACGWRCPTPSEQARGPGNALDDVAAGPAEPRAALERCCPAPTRSSSAHSPACRRATPRRWSGWPCWRSRRVATRRPAGWAKRRRATRSS